MPLLFLTVIGNRKNIPCISSMDQNWTKYPLEIWKFNIMSMETTLWIYQATGMTKFPGGYFRRGGILVFRLRGVYTP